jgi:hypothetical protein
MGKKGKKCDQIFVAGNEGKKQAVQWLQVKYQKEKYTKGCNSLQFVCNSICRGVKESFLLLVGVFYMLVKYYSIILIVKR